MASRAKQLLVEGSDDLHSVVNLMKAHIIWPEKEDDWPVTICNRGGVSNILHESFMSTKMKESGLEILGILLDADTDCPGRWTSIRNICRKHFPDMSATLPPSGIVVDNTDTGKRLGIWVMPDNNLAGTLETFLQKLVPQQGDNRLWNHAEGSVTTAGTLGAPFGTQVDKARLHTWLAWQDPPGRPFGTALTAEILNPKSHAAQPFVNWFCKLYRIGLINHVGGVEASQSPPSPHSPAPPSSPGPRYTVGPPPRASRSHRSGSGNPCRLSPRIAP